jgi:hypothetical protein
MDAPAIVQLSSGIQADVREHNPQRWATATVSGLTVYTGLEALDRVEDGFAGQESASAAAEEELATTPVAELFDNPIPMSVEADIESMVAADVDSEADLYTDASMPETKEASSIVLLLDYDTPSLPVAEENGEVDYSQTLYLESDANYDVELLTWRAVKDLIPTSEPIVVIDVRTGLSFNMKCVSKGRHADVEPLTREDTETIKEVFGGRWSWTPRPVWVIFDGRVFAASINGTPHGGSTISGNGMNGHLCMHFQGSRTHNGNSSHERDHQSAVMEAWNAR